MDGTPPEFERLQADWLPYGEALGRIVAAARPPAVVEASATEAVGRSLARPVIARATLPSWPNSAMDGFAVRSSDVPGSGPDARGRAASGSAPDEGVVRLPVAGRSYPGSAPIRSVPPGAAVRIMTGGPLPVGFDSVIRVEHTDGEATAGTVTIHRTDDVGRHVRAAGKDMKAGDETLAAGTRIHSGVVPMILASGAERLAVHRRPRVGVLSSGDELVEPDRFDEVARGEAIPDTNRAMIAAGVAEAGGRAVDLGVAPDDAEGLRERIEGVRGIDVLVSTGGASMGEKDLLKRILMDLSFRLDFWRVRMRPGSPVSFGHLVRDYREIPVFGLPGNPGSAFVTFHALVAPHLGAMLGAPRPAGTVVGAVAGSELRSPAGLTQFFRVRFADQGAGGGTAGAPAQGIARVELTGPQGSGLVRSLPGAEGLAVMPEGVERIGAGEVVQVLLLPAAVRG